MLKESMRICDDKLLCSTSEQENNLTFSGNIAMLECVHACVRACVHAGVQACVRVPVCACVSLNIS